MTDVQFDLLMDKLDEINQNIRLVTIKETGKDRWGLSDISSDLSSVQSSVDNLEYAIKRLDK